MFKQKPRLLDERLVRQAVIGSGIMHMGEKPELATVVEDAKRLFRADWAAIVTVLDGWQHVVVSTGGHLGEHRRDACLTPYAMMSGASVFYILNTREERAYAKCTFVENRLIAFYAAASILCRRGLPVGVLCITNRNKRDSFSALNRLLLAKKAKEVSLTIKTKGY